MNKASTVVFLTAFADYLHHHPAEIGERWMQMVRDSPDLPATMRTSTEALQAHVPELLKTLVERLRSEKDDFVGGALSPGHGGAQWLAGANLSDLIWEIYIIRRVLTQSVLADFARAQQAHPKEEYAKAETLIHDFFHRLTCTTVGQFIAEQQRTMQEKNQQLQQTSESRERLTRTVSHELRNVLNALTLAITLLGEEAGEEERRDIGVVCARMLADMSRILNDLLDYSALMAGHGQLFFERLALPELFQEIVAEWRPAAEERGLVFESKCEESLGEIVSDKLKLKQIAGNLLSNAIKYRKPAEGGYVGISFAVYGETSWGMVVVDTGLGIAKEDMEALFSDFHRIRPSSAVDGTGLGLAICKEFTELLGGRIEAISEEEQGTRFEVTLPIRHDLPVVSESEAASAGRAKLAEAGQPAFQLF